MIAKDLFLSQKAGRQSMTRTSFLVLVATTSIIDVLRTLIQATSPNLC